MCLASYTHFFSESFIEPNFQLGDSFHRPARRSVVPFTAVQLPRATRTESCCSRSIRALFLINFATLFSRSPVLVTTNNTRARSAAESMTGSSSYLLCRTWTRTRTRSFTAGRVIIHKRWHMAPDSFFFFGVMCSAVEF